MLNIDLNTLISPLLIVVPADNSSANAETSTDPKDNKHASLREHFKRKRDNRRNNKNRKKRKKLKHIANSERVEQLGKFYMYCMMVNILPEHIHLPCTRSQSCREWRTCRNISQ